MRLLNGFGNSFNLAWFKQCFQIQSNEYCLNGLVNLYSLSLKNLILVVFFWFGLTYMIPIKTATLEIQVLEDGWSVANNDFANQFYVLPLRYMKSVSDTLIISINKAYMSYGSWQGYWKVFLSLAFKIHGEYLWYSNYFNQ